MVTSSKLRRLQRARRLRRRRSAALMILTIMLITAAHAAFSKQSTSSESYDVVSVVVKPGDTLWSIAKEYKPSGKNMSEFVYEISSNNGIKDCNIICGQTIFVPKM